MIRVFMVTSLALLISNHAFAEDETCVRPPNSPGPGEKWCDIESGLVAIEVKPCCLNWQKRDDMSEEEYRKSLEDNKKSLEQWRKANQAEGYFNRVEYNSQMNSYRSGMNTYLKNSSKTQMNGAK